MTDCVSRFGVPRLRPPVFRPSAISFLDLLSNVSCDFHDSRIGNYLEPGGLIFWRALFPSILRQAAGPS